VLVYVLGQTVPEATTASLLVVAAGAVAGGLGHARAGRVCWRHAGSFAAAAVPACVAGAVAVATYLLISVSFLGGPPGAA
jgi:uncharacterized protein